MTKTAKILLYSNGNDSSFKFPMKKMPELVSLLQQSPSGVKNYPALDFFYIHAKECRGGDMDVSLNVYESQECAQSLTEIFLK